MKLLAVILIYGLFVVLLLCIKYYDVRFESREDGFYIVWTKDITDIATNFEHKVTYCKKLF